MGAHDDIPIPVYTKPHTALKRIPRTKFTGH